MIYFIIGIAVFVIFVFFGSFIAEKVSSFAKKIFKIVALCSLYGLYAKLITDLFEYSSTFWLYFFCLLPIGIWILYRALSFESRVNKQISNYINFILNGDTTGKTILFDDFLSLEATQKLMKERKQVKDKPILQYIHEHFNHIFFNNLRNRIQQDDIDKNERIYFYWEYYKYLDYLDKCNIELADYIDKISAVDMSYVYISGLAFFSIRILDKINMSFMQFVESIPSLKSAPFSTYTLKNEAYHNGFLNPYIEPSTLQAFENDPDLYHDDFSDIYHNILDFEIKECFENRLIVHSSMHVQDSNDKEEYYELNHESSNGIEEYGKEIEEHRISMDDSLEDIDMLEGCVA